MHKAVIGLGFGDEGKGLTIDYLASRHPNSLNVRFSGGHQVGHTVVSKEKDLRHVFSNFGSGTIQGLPTYWSKHCTVCPIGLMNELDVLNSKGITPGIYINGDCPIVTPMDRNANRRSEKQDAHGSCGVGFGATIQREESFYSLTFRDIFYPQVLKAKLESIRKNYYYTGWSERLSEFVECCDEISKMENVKLADGPLPSEGYCIFEGSQGLLLDQSYGFFPNVTRSNTGSKNLDMVTGDIDWFLVTRAYQTRHGNGFMTNEGISHNIKLDEDETNVTNEYQGEFRRTLLDVSLLEYAIAKDERIRESRNKNLVITCLDHIRGEYRFTHKGEIVHCMDADEFIYSVSKILGIKNVYISESADGETMRKVR